MDLLRVMDIIVQRSVWIELYISNAIFMVALMVVFYLNFKRRLFLYHHHLTPSASNESPSEHFNEPATRLFLEVFLRGGLQGLKFRRLIMQWSFQKSHQYH